jgi:hypothetical protein
LKDPKDEFIYSHDVNNMYGCVLTYELPYECTGVIDFVNEVDIDNYNQVIHKNCYY